jgi:hypothetical protein
MRSRWPYPWIGVAMIALGFLVVWLFGGCATPAVRTYRNGPETFVTGEPLAVAAWCRALPSVNHHGAPVALSTGCAMWTATTATIACADDRPECIAHELRHILDPTWDHR